MARITGPADGTVPEFKLSDEFSLTVPIDLPEGGFLRVISGTSPFVTPTAVQIVPRGGAVAVVPPAVVAKLAPNLPNEPELAGKDLTLVGLPPCQPCGCPLLTPYWCPKGAILEVIVGENPAALPVPSTPVPEGAIVAQLPPEAAEVFRAMFRQAMKMIGNPYLVGAEPNGARP